MEFLDRIVLDNSVRELLSVSAIIILVVIFRRLLSRYLASGIFYIIQLFWKTVSRKEFVVLVFKPMSWLLSITVALIALDKLQFPEAWDIKIHKLPLVLLLDKLGIAIWIMSFIKLLLSAVNFIALILQNNALKTVDKTDDQLVSFFREFIKVIIWILGVLMLLKAVFNQNVGYLLTSLSIVGAALALSAKESLENLIASFIIFFDKPFFVGDTVKVNAVTGTVERIGLRSTRIRTTDKTLVTVPNKQMVDSVVDNWSLRTGRRAEMRLELSEDNGADKVKQLIESINQYLQALQPLTLESATVFLSDYNKNGPTVFVEMVTPHLPLARFNEIRQEVNFAIMQILKAQDIKPASNSANLTIVNAEGDVPETFKDKPII